MSGRIRKTLAGAGLAILAFGGSALALPGSAPAAPALPTPGSNYCGLPTSAPPGSHYLRYFNDCGICIRQAAADTNATGTRYYCTYNPSNGHSDEHW
jgi:hypothetical protein